MGYESEEDYDHCMAEEAYAEKEQNSWADQAEFEEQQALIDAEKALKPETDS